MAYAVNWKRLMRRTLRVTATVAALFLIAWLSLAWYVNAHKAEILTTLSRKLSEDLRGELRIGALEPSVFRSFPNISLDLRDVSLRDSLWQQHKNSLLECRNLYVKVNPLALLTHRVEVKKITAANGSVFIYTDSSGYSNTYLLERKDTTKKNKPALVEHFGMQNIHLRFVNRLKQKLFHCHIKELDGSSSRLAGVISTKVSGKVFVHSMAFNLARGSYLTNQELRFDMRLTYRVADKHLHIPEQTLRISGSPIRLAGNFYLNRDPAAFDIRLSAQDVPFRKALSWTSGNIQRVLGNYDFSRPVSMKIFVSGEMKYRSIPLIKVLYPIRNNTLITPLGKIDRLSYDGEYYNQVRAGAGHGDNNSRIALYRLSGEWKAIPFNADTIEVSNLLAPVIKARVRSSFPLTSLNPVVGATVMSFESGNASADLRYDGSILPEDTTPHFINGFVNIRDASTTYIPRNFAFTNVNASLLFRGHDLFFRNITMRSKNSSLTMEGDALNFLRFYFSDPGKAIISWRLKSPMINLNDFTGFVAKRRGVQRSQPARRNAVTRIEHQMAIALEAATFSMDARIDRMLYKTFNAHDVIARATFAQSGIRLEKVQVRHGGGSLNISGNIDQAAANNPFHIKTTVTKADVAELFSSFNNFGQTAITSENLRGLINADADVTGNITDAGSILKNSFNGFVRFRLEHGAILRFAPFEKLGQFAFKKRNLSAVEVKELQGQLDLKGSKILIQPMSIQTSAINMNVQGVYGLNGGTDIFIEVPLRNPEREGARTPVGMLLRRGKGIVLHLRAQDPTGEGVKIGWDPLRRGRKSTEGVLSEEQ